MEPSAFDHGKQFAIDASCMFWRNKVRLTFTINNIRKASKERESSTFPIKPAFEELSKMEIVEQRASGVHFQEAKFDESFNETCRGSGGWHLALL